MTELVYKKPNQYSNATAKALNERLGAPINIADYGAVMDGVTDDTVAFQNAMPVNGGYVYIGKNVKITSPITIYSNTHLELAPNASILVPINASAFPILRNSAIINLNRTVSDANASNGTSIITSNTANFTQSDVGKSITLAEGGYPETTGTNLPNYANPELYATIVSVESATSITIDRLIYANVSNKSLIVYNQDSNIKITGGTWDKKNVLHHGLMFRRVNGLTIRDFNITSYEQGAGGNYAISLADVKNVLIENGEFNTYSDGVHISGGFENVILRDLRGKTGDDFIGVTTRDWAGASRDSHEIYGSGSRLLIENITGSSLTGVIRIEGAETTKLDYIKIRNINPISNSGGIIVTGSDFFGSITIDNISIENIGGAIIPTARTVNPISLFVTNGGSLLIDKIALNSYTVSPVGFVITQNSWSKVKIKNIDVVSSANLAVLSLAGTINDLLVENIKITNSNYECSLFVGSSLNVKNARLLNLEYINNRVSGYAGTAVNTSGNFANLAIDNLIITSDTAAQIEAIRTLAGTIDKMIVINSKISFQNTSAGRLVEFKDTSIGKEIYITDTSLIGKVSLLEIAANISRVFINNVFVDSTDRTIGNLNSSQPINLFISNSELKSSSGLAAIFLSGLTSLNIYGSGVKINGTFSGIQRDSTEVVRVVNPTFPADVSLLAKNEGDTCINTNASLACGIGRVHSDGTKWKHMYSGVEYP